MELERGQFEEVALAHFVAQRAAGVQISGDNGCEPTRESLFWRDDKGDYGVRMFNAAWWGWKEAAVATRKTCEVSPLDEAAMARLAYAAAGASPVEPSLAGVVEPFEVDWPEYHQQAMGCGLEDRGIRDRYEAMQYGWEQAIERVAERLPETLYATPQAPAQPPAPGEAAREYMTGYSDGRKWAGATSQAGELNDAKRLDWIRDQLFEHKWNGVVGKGCAVQWAVAPDFRFKQRELTDDSGIAAGDFRRAIDAAIKAKERAAHGIKQGGQHD